jgi:tRNA threonylcarbamoyladenosine biosynthesis protein TsaB
MRILACDTTGPSVSVAIWGNDRVQAETHLNLGYIHSVTFMPLVSDIFDRAGCKPEDISLYAVTTGPGSFTGTRIGISAVKAMAYATQKPVLGFSTLDVLAWPYQVCEQTLVCPMIDARNERAYCAAWLKREQIMAPGNRRIKDFLERVSRWLKDREAFCSALLIGKKPDKGEKPDDGQLMIWAPESARFPRAGILAEMASHVYKEGRREDPAVLKATYLVPSGAERLYDERREKS